MRVSAKAALAGGATALVGFVSLIVGMLAPPQMLVTGQLSVGAWAMPALAGGLFLARLLWAILGQWRVSAIVAAGLAVIAPPVLLCWTGAAGNGLRVSPWVATLPVAPNRPTVAVLSGPVVAPAIGGEGRASLWSALSRMFTLATLDALAPSELERFRTLLLIQPRALAPEELVALDSWVRMGGRAVILADPDLRWADKRALGHPLRPPPASLLGPLLIHWGLTLAPSTQADVERRVLDSGQMIQIAGASQLFPKTSVCTIEERGLVARCPVGRGGAIVVADADFANDGLWTAAPDAPLDTGGWTSDAVPFLADLLAPGAGEGAGRRVWLARADGLPAALRPALLALGAFSVLVTLFAAARRTKRETARPVPS
jgi:hypothetical protein